MITVLYKDDRRNKMEYGDLLEKMFVGQVIKKPDVKKFEESLALHQNVRGKEGYTVLEKALLEHNIEVISKLYANISFTELGRFLEIPPAQAEKLISQMVIENRIKATLDQIEQIVEFASEGSQFGLFNRQVGHLCGEIGSLLSDIMKSHPSLVKEEVHLA